MLSGDTNSTSSVSYVTYCGVSRENLMVFYKLCITNKGGPTVTKLQEAEELWQNTHCTCFYFPNLPISRKFADCLNSEMCLAFVFLMLNTEHR